MVIVPCSMATLGRIASGSSDTALLRAADVFLKERRKLILVPRETPWSLIHARNVVTLLEAGAVVLPAIPSFYSRPQSVEDVADTVVWRILDQIGLPNPRAYRWKDEISESLRAKLKLEAGGRAALIAFGFGLFRLWARTLRLRWKIRQTCLRGRATSHSFSRSGTIACSCCRLFFGLVFPPAAASALISASRDGDLVADSHRTFGYGTVRGSSSRKGASALRQLVEVLAAGTQRLDHARWPARPGL